MACVIQLRRWLDKIIAKYTHAWAEQWIYNDSGILVNQIALMWRQLDFFAFTFFYN